MSCVKPEYEKTADGVIVKLEQKQSNDLKMVRLQVINDKTIHVSATPEDKFSEEKSLIILPQTGKTPSFLLENKNGTVVLSTKNLKAFVNLKTGEVNFADIKGNSILNPLTLCAALISCAVMSLSALVAEQCITIRFISLILFFCYSLPFGNYFIFKCRYSF